MAVITGHTGNSYCMYDKGKAYPLSLERALAEGEYPVKIEFTTLTGSPNSYYTSGYKSDRNSLTVYVCDADGKNRVELYKVDSDRYKRIGTTMEEKYKSASFNGSALAGKTICLLGEGHNGCYLRNICQIRITTAKGTVEPEKPTNPDLYKKLLPTVNQNDKMVGLARRSDWRVKVKGVDITDVLKHNLISLEVTDNEEGQADDLQIKISDRDGLWLQKWLNETVQKGSKTKGLSFAVWIGSTDHTGKVLQQKAGTFLLDTMDHDGPPAQVKLKCTSLDCQGGIRKDENDKCWENVKLKGIASDIAKKGKLKLLYCVSKNPKYERKQQDSETDIAFLIRLCDDVGLSVKISDGQLIIFDRKSFEAGNSVKTIKFGDGSYTKWSLGTGNGKTTYDICTVTYTDPKTGKSYKGEYKSPEWQEEEDRVAEANKDKSDDDEKETPTHTELKIKNKRVTSNKQAKELAEIELNLKNLFERTATFTVPGNPALMAGLPVTLKDFGYWSGKYMISTCTHSISSSGYTTKIKLRFIKEK